jgi:hypothetical protein
VTEQPVDAPGASESDSGQAMRTSLNRSWVIKTSIFAIVLGALGIWGLIDATIVYPARGREYASFVEQQYLLASNEALLLSQASVPDPKATLDDLNTRRRELEEAIRNAVDGSITFRRTQRDILRREWLTALSRIGHLTPEFSTFENPAERLQTLSAQWQNQTNTPKALAAYDIPTQWIFVVVGGFGCAWFLFLMFRASRNVFTYDEPTRTLGLPDGRSFTPDDVSDVDKRKWDKFFVTIRLKDGSLIKLDLLRYAPLEDWVLEMEKHTEGYEPDEDEEGGDADDVSADDAEEESDDDEAVRSESSV